MSKIKNPNSQHYLYVITNSINNKIYIGITSDLNQRWSNHKSTSKKSKTYNDIYQDMKIHGSHNFKQIPICALPTENIALKVEEGIIKLLEALKLPLYNIAKGGSGTKGVKWTKERKDNFLTNSSGSKSKLSKLTAEQAIEVKEKYATNKYSHRSLAKEYNVSNNLIYRLLNNLAYKDVLF